MNHELISIAIIGLGRIGFGYDVNSLAYKPRTHIGAILKNPNFRIVGVCDSSKVARNNFENNSKLCVPIFESIEDLVSNTSPQVIVIATSQEEQVKSLLTCLNSKNLKIVFCEKPFCTDLEGALSVQDLYMKKKVPILVNYHRRWDSRLADLKIELNHNLEIYSGIFKFSKNLNNYGLHAIDFLQYLFGEIGQVNASRFSLEGFDVGPISANLLFKKGHNFQLVEVNSPNIDLFELEIISQNGVYQVEFGGERITFRKFIETPSYPGYFWLDESRRLFVDAQVDGLTNAYNEISDYFHGKDLINTCTERDAISNHIVVNALVTSASLNKIIHL